MRSPRPTFVAVDGDTLDLALTGSGDISDPFNLTAEVTLDPAPGNLATLSAAGLMVTAPAPTPATTVTVTDSATIDLTITGTGAPYDITATVSAPLDQLPAPTGPLSLGGQTIEDVANPVNPQDAATRAWVLANLPVIDYPVDDVADTATIDLTLSALDVLSAAIVAGSVDTVHLAPDAVTAAILADNAVDTAAIQNGAVNGPKIAAGAVDTPQLALDAVDATILAANSVQDQHLDASVVSGLGPNVLTQDVNGALVAAPQTSLAYNGANGVFTFTDPYGNVTNIDTSLESIITASAFNAGTNDLTLTMADGNVITTNLSALIDTYALAVTDTATIDITLGGDGSTGTPWNISAVVRPGSIGTAEVANGSLLAADIVPGEVLVDVVDTVTINLTKNPATGVLSADINPDSIDTVHIAPGAITATEIQPGAAVVSATDTATVDLAISAVGDLTADVIVDPAPANILAVTAAGLFVAAPADATTVANTASIDLTLTGDQITADLNLSASPGNALSVNADGLYVATAVSTVSDTATVDLTLTGSNVAADVKVSATAGNTLVVNADGLYVAGGTTYTVSDTPTVDLTLTGSDITAATKLSATAGNALVANADGLYVATVTAPVQTVTDTATVDLTLTGTDIAADVKLSATAGNALSVNADGLFAPVGGVTVADTDTVGLTLTGSAITAEVILDPAANNTLTASAAGLFAAAAIETPAGAAYPDPNGDGAPSIGVEDQDGNPLAFDAVSGEWSVPVARVAAVAPVAAPAVNSTQAFATHQTITIGGATFVDTIYVWDPATASHLRVLKPRRDFVSDETSYDAGVALASSPAVTPLSVGDGVLNAVWVTADTSLLSAAATLNIVINGSVVGFISLPAGGLPGPPTLVAIPPTALAASSFATFGLVGDGNGGELISNICITFDWSE